LVPDAYGKKTSAKNRRQEMELIYGTHLLTMCRGYKL